MQQCMELTNTNRSRAYPKLPTKVKSSLVADSEYFGGARNKNREMLRKH